jgi:transcriptional regulator with XRE-family HTH domain
MSNEGRQYSSIEEMIDSLSEGHELRDEYQSRTQARQLVRILAATRCAKRLTQDDVAKSLKTSQGYISKLENSDDAELKLGEVTSYLDVLGLDIVSSIQPKNLTTLDHIKYHASEIRGYLTELAELADVEDGSAHSIASTFIEVLYNLTKMVADSAEKMPKHPDTNRPLCRVQMRMVIDPTLVGQKGRLCGPSP